MKTLDRTAALRELRELVGTYLEGSDDAQRAVELLNALELSARMPALPRPTDAYPRPTDAYQQERERGMFGYTAAQIDTALARCKEPRDIAMFAMGALSDAQELIYCGVIGDWHVHDANMLRQLINVAKYAIDKAVPR